MSKAVTDTVTRILGDACGGDRSAAERLFPLVYDELRALAGQMFDRQPPDHTLQPTALVHEVYARLVNQGEVAWTDRAHFLAVAAKAMRRLLIDYARKRKAAKRGEGWQRITLDLVIDKAAERSIDLLALEEALEELARLHERQARVVEMHFFGGMTILETATALGVSPGTVDNDWAMARAWLSCKLSDEHVPAMSTTD